MPAPLVLSFDVEEHDRIEAAAGLPVSGEAKRGYAARMEASTLRILEQLSAAKAPATFYIVGQIAETHPRLVRTIAEAGHEIGSHSWEHLRLNRHTPAGFRDDLKRSIEALEQAGGTKVVGFRAPTFSVTRATAWAVDEMANLGLRYDSSVFPVRHDRYGEPNAPRGPFLLQGAERSLLELPPLTYRIVGQNLPVAGGGYFRLFPPFIMRAGIRQLPEEPAALGMLYFHPWEFDPGQPKLPLKRISRFRTYVGVRRSAARLGDLLKRYAGRFRRAVDVVDDLEPMRDRLPTFRFKDANSSPLGERVARRSRDG